MRETILAPEKMDVQREMSNKSSTELSLTGTWVLFLIFKTVDSLVHSRQIHKLSLRFLVLFPPASIGGMN